MITSGQSVSEADRLRAYVERTWSDLAGYDPYDALNSPILRWLSGESRLRRLAFLQALRRLPLDPRSLLRVQPHVNPKTVSLFARAYLYTAPERARKYLEWLEEHAVQGRSGACWGYSFAWQSRRLFLERGAPSAVCTAFVARAFLEAYATWGESPHLEIAASAARFLLRDCPRQNGCISYVPDRLVMVHNANLLSASVLADVWRFTGAADRELRDVSEAAVEFSLADQQTDGAWPYDGPSRAGPSFIDGFHTGLVLESIDEIGHALGHDYSDVVARGLAFYREHLIASDGRPRRLLGHGAATDIRDCAEALLIFCRFALASDVDRVLNWTLSHMRDQRGFFRFESGSLLTSLNHLAFPRWQAWMLLALDRVTRMQTQRSTFDPVTI